LAIRLDPSLGAAHRDLGLVLRDKGNIAGAIRELRRATELMPKDSSVRYMLSQTLRKAGDPQEADRESALAEQLSRKEKDATLVTAYSNEALWLIESGHPEAAEALHIDPDNPAARFSYALALRHCARYDESIAQLQKVLLRQPDLPSAHFQLGYAYFMEGRFAKALESFTRAETLIPGNANVRNGMGAALAKNGDLRRAAQEFEMARQLDPQTELYKKNLECLKQHLTGCEVSP
jgi:Flp pilus assembly protein TadD